MPCIRSISHGSHLYSVPWAGNRPKQCPCPFQVAIHLPCIRSKLPGPGLNSTSHSLVRNKSEGAFVIPHLVVVNPGDFDWPETAAVTLQAKLSALCMGADGWYRPRVVHRLNPLSQPDPAPLVTHIRDWTPRKMIKQAVEFPVYVRLFRLPAGRDLNAVHPQHRPKKGLSRVGKKWDERDFLVSSPLNPFRRHVEEEDGCRACSPGHETGRRMFPNSSEMRGGDRSFYH